MTTTAEHHLPPAQPLRTRVQHGLHLRMLNPLARFMGLLLFGCGATVSWFQDDVTLFVLLVPAMIAVGGWAVVESELVQRLVRAGATSADHVLVSLCCGVAASGLVLGGASLGAVLARHGGDHVAAYLSPTAFGCLFAAYLVAMLCFGGYDLFQGGFSIRIAAVFAMMGLSAISLVAEFAPWIGWVLVPVLAVLLVLVWFRRHSLYR